MNRNNVYTNILYIYVHTVCCIIFFVQLKDKAEAREKERAKAEEKKVQLPSVSCIPLLTTTCSKENVK